MGFEVRKIPTAVADFDAIVQGGLPEGSVVLLLGDVGAGQHEFVYTSASKLSIVKERPETGHYYLGHFADITAVPEKICYVSFSRSREDVLREVGLSFNDQYRDALKRKLIFKDLSASYFQKSIVPQNWTHGGNGGEAPANPFAKEDRKGVLESLVEFLDENAQDSMIIIDSLTDLVVTKTVDTHDLVGVLRGIQRAAKRWNCVIYFLLTTDIMEKREEQMLLDSVDGVLVFEWNKLYRTTKRQRYMFIEKFMSVLPHIEGDRIARFPTMITSKSGLVVINMEKIS